MMRHICRFIFLLVVSFVAIAAFAVPNDTDEEIRFWEARLARDPFDHITPTKLGAAYLRKAREGGDFAYYPKAESALKKAVDLNPSHYAAQVLLASAYAAQHKFREAIEWAEKAVKAQPKEPDAYGILGDALLELGDVKKAEEAYATLHKMAPSLFSYSRQANLRHLKGDARGAMDHFIKAVEAGRRINAPKENVAWCQVQMGEMRFSAGAWKTAEGHYQDALKTLPDYYLALEHLAELHAAQKHYDEALKLYDRVISLAPHPDFYEAIGKIHAALNKPNEANRWFDRALDGYQKAVEQGNIGYYRHLSKFYAETRKDPTRALRWAQQDLEVRQDVYAYDTLAWARFLNDDLTPAALAIEKALRWGTRDAEMFFHAGMIYERLSRYPQARKYLRWALDANPRFDHADQARQMLRAVQNR